jgi:hypothetical protein
MREITNKYAGIDYDDQNGWVRFSWNPFTPGAEYRQAIQDVIAFATGKRVSKMLNDATHVAITPQLDQQWFAEYWPAYILKSSLRYLAIILPQEAPGMLSMQKLIRSDQNVLDTRYFDSEAEASAWLKSIG